MAAETSFCTGAAAKSSIVVAAANATIPASNSRPAPNRTMASLVNAATIHHYHPARSSRPFMMGARRDRHMAAPKTGSAITTAAGTIRRLRHEIAATTARNHYSRFHRRSFADGIRSVAGDRRSPAGMDPNRAGNVNAKISS